MKKRTLLTIITLSSATALFAQQQSFTSPHSQHRHGMPHAAMQHMAGPHAAAKTTDNNASRCIALVEYGSPGGIFVPQDSSTYSYSGSSGRGSFGLGYPYKYDNGQRYLYFSGLYTNSEKYSQTFDANNNITLSLTQSWDVATSSWINSYQDQYTYDAMNNQLTDIEQQWDVPTSAWVNNFKATNTYSGGYRTTETDQNWNTVTSAWVNESMYTDTYDGSNNITQELDQSWNTTTSAWDNSDKYTYTYDGMNNNTSQLNQIWNSITGAWVNYYKYNYSNYIARYCNQLEVDQNWDSASAAFVNTSEYIDTFNSYNQVTYTYSQTWEDTVGSGAWYTSNSEYATRLYYEIYSTSVAAIANTGGKAVVYPVPAKDVVSIDVTWDEAQAFTVSLYDMTGRLLRRSMVPATTEYKDNMSVNDLPSGNYIIKMEGAKGNLTQSVTITN